MDTDVRQLNTKDLSSRMIPAGDIIPEELQNRLMYWRDKFKQGYFEIGDLANEIIDYVAKRSFIVTQQQVFDAVGYFCGKSGRTIRYYAETSAYFPREVRQDYDESPFSHFVFARSMGARWQEVLEYSQENPNASESKLRSIFLSTESVESYSEPVAVTMQEIEYGVVGEEKEEKVLIASTEGKKQIKNNGHNHYGILSRISNIRESVGYLMDNLYSEKMPEKTRNEVLSSLRVIDAALPSLIKAADVLVQVDK